MKNTYLKLVLAGLGVLAVSAPAVAHHAFAAEFDSTKPIKLQGKVTKMDWINPHSWIHVDVKNPDGSITNWAVECGSPNTLYRHGLTKDSLPAGVEIVVEGYMAKDGGNRANGRDVTFTDGRKLFLGSSAPDAEGK